MSLPLPLRDAERVQALERLGILDTLPEAAYEDVVYLASQICGMPISLISLVDGNRQWFKARTGLSATETPRDISFCAHAICEPEELFIVHDAKNDPRFAENPLVIDQPGIRFYAGAALVDRDGWALGTLCVIDRKPRTLTAEQQRSLQALARQVVNALELRRIVASQNETIHELEETRRDLESSRREAVAATESKSRFLAMMSHEIRAPLNAVVGMATLLDATSLDPEQREYTETILTSSDLLLALINDVLDFSKIESGKLSLEEVAFSLSSCIGTALAVVAPRAKEKRLSLRHLVDASLPNTLMGDPVRLGQILINLLSNAVKFTHRGEVVLQVKGSPTSGGTFALQFTVRDTGIGIAPDKIDQIFEAYRQAEHSTQRLFGGTGLGLAISRSLVEKMNGRMWVESTVGEGSRFHFAIEFSVTDAAPTLQEGPILDVTFASRHPARILVVDDNPISGKISRKLLEHLGYAPDGASEGREALAKVVQKQFDLILIDIEMPELDGQATAREMRKILPRNERPVIAAVTAHALVGDRERFLADGLDEYLPKPLRVDELRSLLARLPATVKSIRESN